MDFAPGDEVHFAGLGTGTVLESRGQGRYAVVIKGRVVVAAARDLERVDAEQGRGRRARRDHRSSTASGLRDAAAAGADAGVTEGRHDAFVQALQSPRAPVLDLHGKTTDEAIALVESFINDALLAGCGEVRIIHGRSGGRVKTAVHGYLRRLSTVAAFRLDPRNAGVTVVVFA